jgi:acetyl esterase
MPLDEQTKRFLDVMALQPQRNVETMSLAELRESVMTMLKIAVPADDPSLSVDDRSTPDGVRVRVYVPPEARGVLVYFHGGGWVVGNTAIVDPVCRRIASKARCAVVSVDYRLAPEHKFPIPFDDCFAATRYAFENYHELATAGPRRIAVGGDSAGGNLAAAVCLKARDEGPPIALQLLVYPAVDTNFNTKSYLDNAKGYGLLRSEMIWFWKQYLNTQEDESNPLAAPNRAADLSGLPRAVVLTAEFDVLRDEGEAYANRLREAGVEVDLRRHEGMIHGFFWHAGMIDRGREAIDSAAATLRSTFQAD